MFPTPPRPEPYAGSRDRDRDSELERIMLPAPPRPDECYAFVSFRETRSASTAVISRTTPVSRAASISDIKPSSYPPLPRCSGRKGEGEGEPLPWMPLGREGSRDGDRMFPAPPRPVEVIFYSQVSDVWILRWGTADAYLIRVARRDGISAAWV